MLMMFAVHCTWVTSNAYSSPSVVLASTNYDGSRNILDDFREAYFWLRQNTDDNARVMSWWDYGYQIAGMANRTTLVDNNTWNNSHIALVGKAMSSNETSAYKIMKMLDVDYVLVIFGGVIGYSGDDINKFLWMVRIAEGEHPQEIKESDYFTPNGEFRVDSAGSPILLNCLITRCVIIALERCRVKDYANRVKSGLPTRTTNLKPKNKYIPRRNNRKGYIKDKLNVIQGKRIQRKGKKKTKSKKAKKST
ncbi:Dolichyl-diphosphooligosaccharide--protein glycosyltransferase subunit stt3b [Desmophyllum pertusum]|uniref:Dolichyl-diphosphooligosaccharide--protein glycosyltransferase subunit stt3b n=1 Tax=Desmophyllum pertusum TaxID=174260 RepID=A0A9W9YTA2_9CNID|nr:Dolichyl-diphosphooligosaccharide--protein glycosyltransferase subunit stt3b [Desmophyllum pertusum]